MDRLRCVRLVFGILLVLTIVAFSLPWYLTESSLLDWHEKMIPSPVKQYFVGGEPYSGWSVLPFTLPSIIGFLLAVFGLFAKHRLNIPVIAGFLTTFGVSIMGVVCSPWIIKTWVEGSYIHGASYMAVTSWWMFAVAVSIASLGSGIWLRNETQKTS